MFERLSPVETSNGRIAVLARRPAENDYVFCDFVASRGREGPPSILATHVPKITSTDTPVSPGPAERDMRCTSARLHISLSILAAVVARGR